jgi:hypothetical protein
LGNGLHEFRVRHDEGEIVRMFGVGSSGVVGCGETVLLRVFVHFYGAKVVLLLGGYDKGADPNERRQQREIAEARRIERGSTSPTARTLQRIAEALDADVRLVSRAS